MKNTRKVLLACLFAVLVMGIFFSCQPKDGESGKVVLNIMGYGDNANAQGQSFVRIAEAFDLANPDIDVVFELLNDEPYHQKVVARLASGDVPDVAYMGSDARWGAPWQEAGQQVDITDYIDTDMYDLALFGSLDNADGDYFYIPNGTANVTSIMYTNVALLDELGLEVPTTYEEMKAMVPVADAAGIQVLGTHGAGSWVWGSCVASNFIAQTTGDANWLQKAVAGEVKFTDPEFVAALEFLQMMVEDDVLSSESVLVDTGTGLSNFSNGKYLFFISGQWDAGNISLELQNTMEMLPFPAIPGAKGQEGTVAAAKSAGYGITKSAMDRGVAEAAMKFIDFFNSEAEVTQRIRDGAIVSSVLKGHILPSDMPRIVSLKSEIAATAPITQVIDSHLTGAPNDTLNTGLQQIVSGSKTPQEIADAVEALVVR